MVLSRVYNDDILFCEGLSGLLEAFVQLIHSGQAASACAHDIRVEMELEEEEMSTCTDNDHLCIRGSESPRRK